MKKKKLEFITHGTFVEHENARYEKRIQRLWTDQEEVDKYQTAEFTVLLPHESTTTWSWQWSGLPENDHCVLIPVGKRHKSGVIVPKEVDLKGEKFRTLSWVYTWVDTFSPGLDPETVALSMTQLPEDALALTWSRVHRSSINGSHKKVYMAYTFSWPVPIFVRTSVEPKSRKLRSGVGGLDPQSDAAFREFEDRMTGEVAKLDSVISPQLQ
jgi:hypothetical protein